MSSHTRIPSPLPEDSEVRKTFPLYSGLLKYFPAALAAVAHHSYNGNQKHNPGQPLQHARGKSGDHEDCIMRHLMEGDYEGVAWRALALLQEKLEQEGAPIAPAATFDKETDDRRQQGTQQQAVQFTKARPAVQGRIGTGREFIDEGNGWFRFIDPVESDWITSSQANVRSEDRTG